MDLAVAGFLWTVVLALTVFRTKPGVVVLASLDGLVTTLPLLLVVYGGILLASVLIESGSLKRLADWFTGAAGSEDRKVSLLAVGMGNALEGAGIIAEPVAAPMLRAYGLRPETAAALSIIGYSGLMTLGLGGVIVTVIVNVTGFPVGDLARQVALLSIPASVFLCWSIPGFTGRQKDLIRRLPFYTLVGLIPGVAAYGAVGAVGYQVGEMAGGAALTLLIVLPGFRMLRVSRQILKDVLPFAVVAAWPVSVIPGRPLFFRPLADAYTYLFAAFLIAWFLMARGRSSLSGALLKGTVQGWRPLAAMALFGAMGQVLSFSGVSLAGGVAVDQARSIPHILAGTMAAAGNLYPLLTPLLGWVGTFLTGYGVASIMLFASLQLGIADALGFSPLLLVTGLAVGASVGGVSSPFKVAFAASMSGADGKEGEILRKTIPLGIAVCLGLGVVLMMMT